MQSRLIKLFHYVRFNGVLTRCAQATYSTLVQVTIFLTCRRQVVTCTDVDISIKSFGTHFNDIQQLLSLNETFERIFCKKAVILSSPRFVYCSVYFCCGILDCILHIYMIETLFIGNICRITLLVFFIGLWCFMTMVKEVVNETRNETQYVWMPG